MANQLRFSARVPPTAVNLAWVQIPDASPEQNLSLVDAARYIAENINLVSDEKINAAGITGDASGNYILTYNPAPASLSGAIETGPSGYVYRKVKTQTISPSGWVIKTFTSQIEVLHPEPNEAEVWRVRVKDGLVIRQYRLRADDKSWLSKAFDVGDTLVCYYTLPEVLRSRSYLAGGSRYIDQQIVHKPDLKCTIIDEHTIQLPDEDLVEITSLKVNEEELVTSGAYQLKIFHEDHSEHVVPPIGPFTAWDPENGQVTLSRSLGERDEVTATYRYREHVYTYEGYKDEDNVYHDLDLNPYPGHTYDGGTATSELLKKLVYLYLLPSAAYRIRTAAGAVEQEREIYTGLRFTHYFLRWESVASAEDNDDTDGGGGGDVDPCRGRFTYGHSYFGSASFVSQVPQDTLPPAGTTGTGLSFAPSALILAKIYTTAAAQVDNVEVIDTRVRGGGIPEGIEPTDPNLPGDTRKQIESYWDLGGWDGQPVPLAGCCLVELPGDLLTGANGRTQFTSEEIEESVNRHMPAGVKAIVRYL
jgi:hypothetical protein